VLRRKQDNEVNGKVKKKLSAALTEMIISFNYKYINDCFSRSAPTAFSLSFNGAEPLVIGGG